jgi:alkaline phosphatase D
MWTGDAVYLESEPGTANSLEHKLAVQRRLFERMQTIEPYRRFAAEVPIIGTWDDHDYGLGNAGSEFLGKIESQKNYLDFLREPADSPRRNQAGVYESYTCGPAEKRVKIYLLDTRFHRDAHGPDGDMLGAEQWAWLKSEMASSDAQINVVVSSIQILLRQGLLGEQWFRWSRSRTRLFDLIESSDLSGVVFVTGDKHFGTIEASQEVDLERQVHEIMSSGMTPHSVISGNNLAMVRLWYGRSRVINVPNFGMIEINWNVSPVQVSLQIRDWKNKVHLRTDLVLEGKQLSPSSAGKTGIQK